MEETKPKKRRASGAGVKPLDGATELSRKQIMIDVGTEAILVAIGRGQLSLGIREAARRLVEHKDAQPFDFDRHKGRKKGT